MPTSLIVPVATAAISGGAQALFGGGGQSSGLTSFTPPGISAGGLQGSFGPGGATVNASAERMAAVNNIASTFGAQADQLGALRSTVTPGFSDLRASRLSEVENARRGAIGNLRENLQRRRVLGSSFGQDAASRTEAEFGAMKDRVQAESFLQELETTNQLMQQEFTARRGQFQTGLDEMNLEANLAAGLAGKATDVLGKNAQIEAMLNAQAQQGAGKFFGQTFQPVAAAAGKSIGTFFNGGGSGGLSPDFGLQF